MAYDSPFIRGRNVSRFGVASVEASNICQAQISLPRSAARTASVAAPRSYLVVSRSNGS